jgi:4-hydroxy-tetrahydrodipicolinate synthase
MHEDGRPDHGGYRRLLDHIFADPTAPLPALWVLGSAGENFQMSYPHRLEVTRVVVESINGRARVLIGCGDPVLSEVFRFFDDTAGLAIDGYHCLPTDRKLSASATIDYWTAVADRAPKPLWLYSNPARALDPAVEAVRVMSQHPNVAGMKIGGYNLASIVPIAAMNSAKFQVMGAGAVNHIVYLALGVTCCAIGTASSFPRQHAEVHTLWEQGRLAEARAKASWMNDVLAQLPPRQNTEESAEEKAILELLGVCRRWVCPPFKPLDDDRMTRVKAVLEKNGLLTPDRRPAAAS